MNKKKAKEIIIKLQHRVKSEFSGIYRSVFKGSGIEYDRIREYQPWDDFKFIEWNSSSRYGKLFVKEYVEERNIPVYIAVDISSSVFCKLLGKPKIEVAAELSAILSSVAQYNNDMISLILFSDRIDYFSPLKNVKNIAMKNYYVIMGIPPEKQKNRETNYEKMIGFLENNIKKRALIFIISDFFPFEIDDKIFNLNKKNEIYLLLIIDPNEENPPKKGIYKFVEPETGYKLKVDFKENKVYYQYKNSYSVKIKRFIKSMKSKGITVIKISTMSDPYLELVKFFKQR